MNTPWACFAIGLLLGLLSGGYIVYDHMQAKQLASVELGVKDAQINQANIANAEKPAAQGVQAEQAKSLKLTGELKHGKNLTSCKLDDATVGLLNQASLPAAKLP